ncbi:MAG TPA: methyltransferase domain-containing protein [Burkholderiaceae bacterium]|nr:methyltransferase domain-containing protein [Burkholderiaceae bacterium]
MLINPGRSIFRASDFSRRATTTFKAAGSLAERIGRMLPSPSRDVGRKKNYRWLAAELRAMDPDQRRVLVVGSGDGSAAYLDVAAVEGVAILETDVSLAGSARIVCDASDLPFDDGSFDMIVCQAVLEHVLEPQRCVDEMHRVLRPGGVIYATTPFMQQVHMGEFDFTRFTRSGHRWLFRNFVELDSGVATGPASVLIWSVEYFLLSWTGRLWLRRCIKALTRITLGWLTLLDPILARRQSAFDASGGFYFIGQRSHDQAISAREMIAYYAGSDSQK